MLIFCSLKSDFVKIFLFILPPGKQTCLELAKTPIGIATDDTGFIGFERQIEGGRLKFSQGLNVSKKNPVPGGFMALLMEGMKRFDDKK